MTTYWCTWCGKTEHVDNDVERVPCTRCLHEFAKRFGFWPEVWMRPLQPGERPGIPASATKQFTVIEVKTGRLVGRTEVPSPGRLIGIFSRRRAPEGSGERSA